jgi:hypothetical protein
VWLIAINFLYFIIGLVLIGALDSLPPLVAEANVA